MQKIATRIFIYASIVFGIIGIALVFFSGPNKPDSAQPALTLMKLLMITVFIILPSFALSVAAKYLNGNKS